jgi:DNA sulfur modification protein DndB
METKQIKNKELSLPCLRGSIGDWNYYNVLISFKELHRIDNKHIIKETKSLDKWLQRELSDRKDKIRDYLLNESQRYFNSIIVGVYGDMPDWYALNLEEISKKFNLNIGNQVQESLGILALTGNEILFTIDGQHRIEGIKLALKENSNRFENDELSVVFIAHNENEAGRIRTRKLFATINRHAVKPSQNDLAIIDEIYAYNVIARDIYAKYKKFENKITLTETTNLDRNNHNDFTNLLALVEVNKKILKLTNYRQSKYSGPSVDERKVLYSLATDYWDFVTKNTVDYRNFFTGKNGLDNYRNSGQNKPLNLLFVPIGQKFLAVIYCFYYKTKKLDILKTKINKIDFNLQKGHFTNLFYNKTKNTMIMNNFTVCKNLVFYLLGEKTDELKLKKDLCRAYGINELSTEFKNFSLPLKL